MLLRLYDKIKEGVTFSLIKRKEAKNEKDEALKRDLNDTDELFGVYLTTLYPPTTRFRAKK